MRPTSRASRGALPTGLNLTTTFSSCEKNKELARARARARVAGGGRAVSSIDAVMVSGSSGDEGRSGIGGAVDVDGDVDAISDAAGEGTDGEAGRWPRSSSVSAREDAM